MRTGRDADTITIASDLVATGLRNLTITTGSGDDTLVVQTANLTLPVSGGTFSFNGGDGSDTIKGPKAAITWNLSGTGSGNLGGAAGLVFTNVENLVGGGDQDLFVFANAASFGGAIDGGPGQNALDYSAYSIAPVTVNLEAGTATGTTGVSNIDNVTGGVGSDNLTGDGKVNILRGGAGNDTLAGGPGNDILEGGAGADTFAFSDGWGQDTLTAGTGGTNIHTLNFSAVTTDLVVTIHVNGTVSVTDSTNGLTEVTGIEAIIGGTGDNRIVFENGATFAGTINAGSGGNNTLDFSNYKTPVLVDLASGTAIVGGYINGTTVVGLTPNMPVRYLNYGAGVSQATISLETLLTTLNGGSGVHTASFFLTRDTLLTGLNNGLGVHTASLTRETSLLANCPDFALEPGYDLQITLTTGDIVTIDLGMVSTMGNVLDAIHAADSRLTAVINASGDGIDISDTAGGSGNLAVADLGTSTAAASLRIAGTGTGPVLHGQPIASDFRIILTDWSSVAVDIRDADTVGDVLDAIHAADSRLTAVINAAGNGIDISDTAGGEEYLAVYDLNGSTTATDLGLTGTSTGNLLHGRPLVSDLLITLGDGSVVKVRLGDVDTIADVIDAINSTDSRLYAELNEASDGIDISDSTTGTGNLTVTNPAGSTAATDLGLAGTGTGDLLHGHSLVNDLLITLSNGTTVEVNLGNPVTMGDVLAAIHAADSRLTAVINPAANGINISDSAGGAGNITITDLNGSSAATDLGIVGTGTGGTILGTPHRWVHRRDDIQQCAACDRRLRR